MLWYDTWYMGTKWYMWIHDRKCGIWSLCDCKIVAIHEYVYYAYDEVHDITWWHDAIRLV